MPIVTDRVAWFDGRSVCRSVTLVIPAKTTQPIEMPFGLRTRVGPRIICIRWVQIPIGMGNFEERRIIKVIHLGLLQAFENTINCLQSCAVEQFNSVDCILIVIRPVSDIYTIPIL